ncbi:SRPBCC family protein [Herbaspirillum sp. SJZ107]|uniref:SRPBCC family protein n=1 Tax=Herbaspirillum sp. SJZ107 TaxID=2572881 RepID=UPI001152AE11|nr:SRPBCC family protein [Herbaspirillum sp. SJZ107]TQK06718.1 putative membrane protein [Herbaspirillum sp. SJZ107]
MAGSIVGEQRGGSSRGSPSPGTPAGRSMQNVSWIPIALGAAAIVAGVKGSTKGAAALALGAVAGAGALGALRGAQSGHSKQGAADGRAEVERSITIGKDADELRRTWLDPRTLPQVMARFATVRAAAEGRMYWKVEGPLGHAYEWDAETLNQPGGDISWRSLPEAAIPNEGSVRFHPAPAGRGTVVTLRVRFDPPGGALGEGLIKLLGSTPLHLIAEGALRRFKNLVETGEIPTTVRQPAARADTH